MFESLPNLHETLLPNQLETPPRMPLDNLIFLHQSEIFLLFTLQAGSRIRALISPYLNTSNDYQTVLVYVKILYAYLLSNTILKRSQCLIPRLSSSFNLQRVHQETQFLIFLLSSPLQRKMH